VNVRAKALCGMVGSLAMATFVTKGTVNTGAKFHEAQKVKTKKSEIFLSSLSVFFYLKRVYEDLYRIGSATYHNLCNL